MLPFIKKKHHANIFYIRIYNLLQNTFGVFIGSILGMKIMKKVHVQEYRLKFIFQIRQKL